MPHESTVAHEHEQKLSREDGNATAAGTTTTSLENTATTAVEVQQNNVVNNYADEASVGVKKKIITKKNVFPDLTQNLRRLKFEVLYIYIIMLIVNPEVPVTYCIALKNTIICANKNITSLNLE